VFLVFGSMSVVGALCWRIRYVPGGGGAVAFVKQARVSVNSRFA
jgi:hypothetical protein